MNYLMKFENYHQNRIDEILDKISSSGINSLTKNELEYLNAFGKEDKDKLLHLDIASRKNNFKSSEGYFEFNLKRIEDLGDEKNYHGVITVPDLVFENGERISGEIEGYIVTLSSWHKITEFQK